MTLDQTAGSARLDRRRLLILLLLCSVQFMVALDFAIVNVALPTIHDELGIATSRLPWVVTAFLLPFAGLLLLAGRAADLYGRRRLLMAGLAVFTLGSLLGGFAPSPAALLGARALQGIGGALLAPAALSLLTTSFAEGPERERALAISGAVLSGGFVAGTILGGLLTDALGWRSTLLVNVPIGALALIAAPLLLAESRPGDAIRRLDLPGALLATAGLTALVFGISQAQVDGWLAPTTLGGAIAGLALLGAFLAVERGAPSPIAPIPVLRRASVAWGNAAGIVTFGTCGGITVVMTLYLQQVLGYSPLEVGLAFVVLGGTAIAGGIVAARIVRRVGAVVALSGGLLAQAAGTALLALVSSSGGLAVVLAGTGVVGFGHVLSVVSYTIVATSGLPDREQGLAGGLVQTAQQVGAALGVAILVAVTTGAPGVLGSATGPEAGLTSGVRLAALVAAAALVLAAVGFVPRLARGAGRDRPAASCELIPAQRSP